MISENSYLQNATALHIELACIKAVAEVESGGAGFIGNRPVILFEPHIFFRQLIKRGIDPQSHIKGNEDIIYRDWRTRPYPSGQDAKWAQLNKAILIDKIAAESSASWGKFQIMGFNYSLCGCGSVQQFVDRIYKGEDEHLVLFCNFLKSTGLDKALRVKDWTGFAKGYNGGGYKKNHYDIRIEAAYHKFKG